MSACGVGECVGGVWCGTVDRGLQEPCPDEICAVCPRGESILMFGKTLGETFDIGGQSQYISTSSLIELNWVDATPGGGRGVENLQALLIVPK